MTANYCTFHKGTDPTIWKQYYSIYTQNKHIDYAMVSHGPNVIGQIWQKRANVNLWKRINDNMNHQRKIQKTNDWIQLLRRIFMYHTLRKNFAKMFMIM